MGRKVFVVGVGMTKFEKPESRGWDYPEMAKESGTKALADAGISYDEIEQAFVGYVYGESTSGQRAVYELGLTGIPIVNVNNNCSTGSTALYLARQAIEGGSAECALALGFEKMQKGSLGGTFMDRAIPVEWHYTKMFELFQPESSPPAPQIFGNAGREHMDRYGSNADHFAWIGWKNHKHSVNNPYAQFQQEYSFEEIQNAKMIHAPLTKLQCSPTSDGSGAVVLASEDFVRKHGLEDQAVEIVGQAMATDPKDTFDKKSAIAIVGAEMTRKAANKVYEQSGYGPEDVDVIELHDCFSTNELITYEALGLCDEGKGHTLVDEQATTYGGKWVVNPSGGLISKGHPLGATGLAQCSELTWQLRGTADARQVDGAKLALQHNIGLGGAVVVTMYRKADLAGAR
ncbi:MAG: lipid-transfer protein [Actinomycetota bacterium]